jgi:hypothetical protein
MAKYRVYTQYHLYYTVTTQRNLEDIITQLRHRFETPEYTCHISQVGANGEFNVYSSIHDKEFWPPIGVKMVKPKMERNFW